MQRINLKNQPAYDQGSDLQAMFTSIARRYDLMNWLMTGGQDTRWRWEVIRRTNLPPGGRILDLGAGTGDLAYLALRQNPDCTPVAADFTLAMMRVGKANRADESINWSAADALNLPFESGCFEAVVSGFLLRNVDDIARSLEEQRRVLKPGGRLVALDTTRPERNLISPFVNFHLHVIIPNLGRLITGSEVAYTYLPDSTEAFMRAEQLADRMREAGFQQVGFRRLMLGTIAIHWAEK